MGKELSCKKMIFTPTKIVITINTLQIKENSLTRHVIEQMPPKQKSPRISS